MIRIFIKKRESSNLQYFIGGGIALILSQFIKIYNVNTMFPAFLLGFLLSISGRIRYFNMSIFVLGSLSSYIICYTILENVEITPIMTNFMRIVRGLAGACFIVSCFNILNRISINSIATRTISKIGRNTLGIYILQTIILEIGVAYYIGNSLAISHSHFFPLIITPLIATIILAISMKLINLINCSQIFSKLLLGKNSLDYYKETKYGTH